MAVDAPAARSAGIAWYSEERWRRFAPLTGVLAVILWILGVAVIESAAGAPPDDAPAAAFVGYYSESGERILTGAFILMIGSALFLWFLGTLRARIRSLEGGGGRLASIVFALGIVVAAMSMAMVAPEAGAGLATSQFDARLEPATAQTFAFAGDGFFVAAEAATAIFFLAAGLAILRTRVLPVWLAWASIVLGIVALIPFLGWAAFVWGLPLWVLISSVLMFTRAESAEGGPETRPAGS